MSRFQVIAEADLPSDIDRNGMKPGAFYVMSSPAFPGRTWLECDGLDTEKDARIAKELLDRGDAEAVMFEEERKAFLVV